MTFARVNPIGWAIYETLTAAQVNSLDVNVSRSLDGYAGGIYTPSATLELVGAGVPTGPTVKLRASATGAALQAVQSSTQAALFVAGATTVAQLAAPQFGAIFLGLGNTLGAGGAPIYSAGGNGGSSGIGGSAASLLGGNATASGFAAGAGLRAQGGVPYDRIITPESGAGVHALGGAPIVSQRRGGAGLYAVGGVGASGGFGGFGVHGHGGAELVADRGGAGGLFQGYGATGFGLIASTIYGERAGVIGVGGTVNGGAGVGGIGVLGIGASGNYLLSYGGYFQGNGIGIGIVAVPGADTVLAAQINGGIYLHSAVGTAKNPATTTAVSNAIYAKNVIKAWGLVRDGVLIAGFNVASVAIDVTTSILEVNLASAMANTDYMVLTQGCYSSTIGNARRYHPTIPGTTAGDFDARTTTFFELVSQDAAAAPISWATGECYFMVLGEQS